MAIVSQLIDPLVTLVAAFAGAWFAFLFERRHKDAEEVRRRVGAVNRALYTLTTQWSAMVQIRQEVIDPHRGRDDAWLNMAATAYEMPTNEGVSQVTRKVVYAGNPAYLIPSPCCDKFDYFYDSSDVILCAPSGGFTGRGDGSCPEVLGSASAKDL